MATTEEFPVPSSDVLHGCVCGVVVLDDAETAIDPGELIELQGLVLGPREKLYDGTFEFGKCLGSRQFIGARHDTWSGAQPP